jgi:hypothetical protein
MRLVPKRRHHLLRAFFRQRLAGTGLSQERLDPWGEVPEQKREGRLVCIVSDAQQQRGPVRFGIRRHSTLTLGTRKTQQASTRSISLPAAKRIRNFQGKHVQCHNGVTGKDCLRIT